ncbi:TonB-dependent receptor [Caulobacter sp. SL161]|uniref:TonB-dependent receptor n=1 Tax=Caulobacter sp. SL161 TaxID=2995156 RepID=UPI0022750FF3|nr:TonB-dependent receptor [Caulobacter sp. SL161]MCY1646623.1 TonB-dependent receptor [Caulobacter sp. SL161]
MPSQPLAQSLLDLAARTGKVIAVAPVIPVDRRAPPLTGLLSVGEALTRLLAGTGLTFGVEANGVIVIRAAPERAAGSGPPPWSPPAAAVIAPVEDLPLSPITVVARPLGERARLERFSPRPIDLLLEEDLQRTGQGGVGDVLSRLPGASATLDAGEARQLAVRGVGARFTLVRVNGMETLATFGATNASGGTNRGRAFDYNVFAADLFHQVRLQKTASADLEEGSLGASVDMRTRSPFDLPARSLRLAVETTYNDAAGRVSPRASVLVAARDRSDRLGVVFSGAYGRRRIAEDGASSGQWETGTAIYPGFGAETTDQSLETLNAALHARIPRLELVRSEQSRLGLTGSLEWRPDDRTRVTADLLYAMLRVERREDLLGSFTFRTAGACAPNAACGLNGVTVRSAQVIDPGAPLPVLIAGTFDNVDVRAEARRDRLETVFRQSTLTMTREFEDGLKASVLLGFSRSDFGNPAQDTVLLQQSGVSGFSYNFADPRRPIIDFGSADLTTPSAWRIVEYRSDPNWVDNVFKSAAFDIERDGPIAWRAGVVHRRYVNTATTLSRSDGGIANINSDLSGRLANASPATFGRIATIGPGFGPQHWLSLDVGRTLAFAAGDCGRTPCDLAARGVGPVANLNYTVGETTDSGFILLARPHSDARRVWGEFGLRWTTTAYDISGLGVVDPGFVGVSTRVRRDQRLLPSLNLAWRLSSDMVARFGAAKVIARPDLLSLRPGVSLTTTGTKLIAGGNPDLKPTQATTVDLALEWRPDPQLAVNLAVFHKSISTMVQTTITRPAQFSANPYGLSDAVATAACGNSPGCSADLPIWQFARPANSGPGNLEGVELAFTQRLISRPRSAWRVQGAASYVRSRVMLIGKSGRLVPFEDALGAPRTAAFLTVQRIAGPTTVGATVTHRGAFVASAPAPNGGEIDGESAVTRLDISASRRLSRGLDLSVDVINLTKASNRQFSDTRHIPTFLHRTGREVRMSLRLKL